MNNPKIIQIIPAPAGMSAMYENADGSMYELPIVALALVEEDGVRNVAPLDMEGYGEVSIATDVPNFCGMLFNGDHLREDNHG